MKALNTDIPEMNLEKNSGDTKSRMRELIRLINEANRAYYQDAAEIMTNYEYDALYDELKKLEEDSGVVLSGSPTTRVGYEVMSELPKERHDKPMLSLDKTKNVEDLKSFMGNKQALISWKMDGLTVVLTYEGGELIKAVTRGNGEVGEVITPNARAFKNVPLKIPFKGSLILRGEAVIGYRDFEAINEAITDEMARYKNPRNLCSGSVRQLDSSITAKRNVSFYAFALVKAEITGNPLSEEYAVKNPDIRGNSNSLEETEPSDGGPGTLTDFENSGKTQVDFGNSRSAQFDFLKAQGFDVVEHYLVTSDTIEEHVKYFAGAIPEMDIPSDGLVLTLEDLEYSLSLGTTAKFPRDSMAYKWADETADTHLLEIEWSPSRTGLINPVAIFEPVELEGTTVTRASVHNVSVMRSLKLGIGDMISVYKANMIIPQIAENKTGSGSVMIPDRCPACGEQTRLNVLGDVETLYCDNPDCPVKKIKSYDLFVSRDALNIVGLSEATLEKFLAKGFIRSYRDIFHLEDHKDEIVAMEGFGEKSFLRLQENADNARRTSLPKLIYSLGIPNVGLATAKIIVKSCNNDLDTVRHAGLEELSVIDGIGSVIAGSVVDYFNDPANNAALDELLPELVIEYAGEEANPGTQAFDGMTFVITGNVYHYANRKEVQDEIEKRGGKVSGSVSSRTNYLINNDIASQSGKNKKAKELGIPIITEEEFIEMLVDRSANNYTK